MENEAIEAILRRHSCRAFTGEPLRQGDLETLMDVFRWAPSAGNLQPWFVYVVKNRKKKVGLAEAAFEQYFLSEAPVVFVVCASPQASAYGYGPRGMHLYCYQDTAAAVENVLIAATALGYGSCWIGAFDEERVRRVLGIAAGLRPVALVAVGPGREPKDYPGRRVAREVFEVLE